MHNMQMLFRKGYFLLILLSLLTLPACRQNTASNTPAGNNTTETRPRQKNDAPDHSRDTSVQKENSDTISSSDSDKTRTARRDRFGEHKRAVTTKSTGARVSSNLKKTTAGADSNTIVASPDDNEEDETGSNPDSPDLPRIVLNREGAIDSVTWRGKELLADRAEGKHRKPLIENALLTKIQGLNAEFKTPSGCMIKATIHPVPDGFDLILNSSGNGTGSVHAHMGEYRTGNPPHALLPIWAGVTRDLTPGKGTPREHKYPGRAFAPIMAIWGDSFTYGCAALAKIDDKIGIQVVYPKTVQRSVEVRIGITGLCGKNRPQQRTITVRFAQGLQQWKKVLQPYRSYQLKRDGPVRYKRLGPWVSYNMRNSHDYDPEVTWNFKPGSTWESTLGKHWEWAMKEARAGRLYVGCLGVWSQMEQVEKPLRFNPNVLDLEKSLGGSLPALVARMKAQYGPITISAFSRPGRKIVNGKIVTRDLRNPVEFRAAMAQLQGLYELGFDAAYADELGIFSGWAAVDLVEQAPVRVIPEWAWDRMITRASCLMAAHEFPREHAALLIPYLTPGGELYVRASAARWPLFKEGAVTPWSEWVGPHNQSIWNQLTTAARAARAARGE